MKKLKILLRNEPILTIYSGLIAILFLLLWIILQNLALTFIVVSTVFVVFTYPVYQLRKRIRMYRIFMHLKEILTLSNSKIDVVNIGFVIKSVKSEHYRSWQRSYWQEINYLYQKKKEIYVA